jgi:hypothetical protein
MHGIASAFAGSLWTSAALTGSRPLPLSGCLLHRLGSCWRRCGGACTQSQGQPAQPRAKAEATPLHLSSYGLLSRGDDCNLSGWPAGLRGGLLGVSCGVASPAAGLRCGGKECSGHSSNVFKSFGRAMASTSSGWPVQQRVYAMVHQETAARRAASPTAGLHRG